MTNTEELNTQLKNESIVSKLRVPHPAHSLCGSSVHPLSILHVLAGSARATHNMLLSPNQPI